MDTVKRMNSLKTIHTPNETWLQEFISAIRRPNWTPYMHQCHQEFNDNSAHSAMLVVLICICLLRLSFIFGYLFGLIVVSTTLIYLSIPLFFTLYCVMRRIAVRPLRYLTPAIIHLSFLPTILDESDPEAVGYLFGAMYVIFIVEAQTIVRHVAVELIYNLSLQIMIIIVVKTKNFGDTPGLRSSLLVCFMFCTTFTITKSISEKNLFEARFETKELNSVVESLPVGLLVKTKQEALLENDLYLGFLEDLTQIERSELHERTPKGRAIEFDLHISRRGEELTAKQSLLIPTKEKTLDIRKKVLKWFDQEAELYVIQDVTESQELISSLKELDQFKTNLIRTVSHDFRTPLNVILNGLETIIQEKDLAKDAKKLAESGHQASKFLLFLVNDLVDYYQLKTETFRVAETVFDPLLTVRQIVSLMESKAQTCQVEMNVETVGTLPRKIRNDPERIQQILLNLISNALKFSKKKSKVNVRLRGVIVASHSDESLEHQEITPNEGLMVEVEDFGLGIRSEDVPKMFTEFGRVMNEENLRLNPKGVGLGLWISRQISLQVGEGLSLESTYGKGSTFRFQISNRLQDRSPTIKRKSLKKISRKVPGRLLVQPLGNRQSFGGDSAEIPGPKMLVSQLAGKEMKHKESNSGQVERKDVLILDDELFNQVVLKEIFKRFNLECNFFADPLDCLAELASRLCETKQKWKETNERPTADCSSDDESIGEEGTSALKQLLTDSWYKMFVIDYDMPGMLGPEVIKKIRELEQEYDLRPATVFGHTAFGEKEHNEMLSNGADEILVKPVNLPSLMELLEISGFVDNQGESRFPN